MSIIPHTFTENIRIALRSVRDHMLRSILTMLIIAFGITALVGILTAIDSIRYSLTNEFSRMGANTFSISNSDMFARKASEVSKAPPAITYREADEFRGRFGYGATVSYYVFGNPTNTIRYRDKKTNPNITMTGCNENYFITTGYNIGLGRVFSTDEAAQGAPVAIIGSVLTERLFGSHEDPLSKLISVSGAKYRVIGVLEAKGSSMGFSGDNNIFVPVNNLRKILSDANRSYQIDIKASDAVMIEGNIEEARALFRKIRKLKPGEPDNFSIEQSDNLVQVLMDNISTITLAATFIGLITLLGAAIGLMNIMLVSVTERTREIGIRKAIGATPALIRNQFLIEAIVIGVLGGIIGIAGGVMMGNITTMLTGGKFIIPWTWMLMGVLLCIFVGLISGFYPASRAARLDPIESLRYE